SPCRRSAPLSMCRSAWGWVDVRQSAKTFDKDRTRRRGGLRGVDDCHGDRSAAGAGANVGAEGCLCLVIRCDRGVERVLEPAAPDRLLQRGVAISAQLKGAGAPGRVCTRGRSPRAMAARASGVVRNAALT